MRDLQKKLDRLFTAVRNLAESATPIFEGSGKNSDEYVVPAKEYIELLQCFDAAAGPGEKLSNRRLSGPVLYDELDRLPVLPEVDDDC